MTHHCTRNLTFSRQPVLFGVCSSFLEDQTLDVFPFNPPSNLCSITDISKKKSITLLTNVTMVVNIGQDGDLQGTADTS